MRFFATIVALFGVSEAIKVNMQPSGDTFLQIANQMNQMKREGGRGRRNRGPSRGELVRVAGWIADAAAASDDKQLTEEQLVAAGKAYVKAHNIEAPED